MISDEVKQTEEILLGQSLLSCYDFVEQSCEYIVKQLSYMQKLRYIITFILCNFNLYSGLHNYL